MSHACVLAGNSKNVYFDLFFASVARRKIHSKCAFHNQQCVYCASITIVRQALFSSRYCDIVVIIIFYILVVTQFEILENNVLNLI